MSRISRVYVLERTGRCGWKASNRLQTEPCDTRTISVLFSRLHQFQTPIFMRHLPVPILLNVLTATAIFSLFPLSRCCRSSTDSSTGSTTSRTRECVVHFPAAEAPLRDRHAPHPARRKVRIHGTRHLKRSCEAKYPLRSVVYSQVFPMYDA